MVAVGANQQFRAELAAVFQREDDPILCCFKSGQLRRAELDDSVMGGHGIEHDIAQLPRHDDGSEVSLPIIL